MKNSRIYESVILLVLALVMLGCVKNQAGQTVPQPPEKTWRDIITADHAVLVAEQTRRATACKANPTASVCVAINKAGAAENIARDALNVYCQFSPADPPTKACAPVPSALAALQSALGQLSDLTTQVQVLSGATP